MDLPADGVRVQLYNPKMQIFLCPTDLEGDRVRQFSTSQIAAVDARSGPDTRPGPAWTGPPTGCCLLRPLKANFVYPGGISFQFERTITTGEIHEPGDAHFFWELRPIKTTVEQIPPLRPVVPAPVAFSENPDQMDATYHYYTCYGGAAKGLGQIVVFDDAPRPPNRRGWCLCGSRSAVKQDRPTGTFLDLPASLANESGNLRFHMGLINSRLFHEHTYLRQYVYKGNAAIGLDGKFSLQASTNRAHAQGFDLKDVERHELLLTRHSGLEAYIEELQMLLRSVVAYALRDLDWREPAHPRLGYMHVHGAPDIRDLPSAMDQTIPGLGQ
ncbi:hypothetical protein WJX72_009908 [[Myrmecia] bisecta]|uniref:Uncharacterized protein n=1 Tax=[Myrmecia] bisecta TaxID=41462 RepID=A0AAW1R948_9CHLO